MAQPTSSPSELVTSYIDEVLNEHDINAILSIFHPEFVDRNPLEIPGVLDPKGAAGVAGIVAQVQFLAAPGVDIRFNLEEVFDNGLDHASYRVFGEGSVPISADQVAEGRWNESPVTAVRKLDVAGTGLAFHGADLDRLPAVPGQLEIIYTCVGMFRVNDGFLVERWGRIYIE